MMTEQRKLKTLVRAPALVSAGYGVHSRQIIFALLNDPDIDLYIEQIPWGACAYLTDNNKETQLIKQLARRYNKLRADKQDNNFDLFISITIPQEFERRGAINIGVTAAAETDRCSPQWISKCNEMDAIIATSSHAKKNLSTVIQWKTNEQSGELKLQRPCLVCPEGFDPRYFHKKDKLTTRVSELKFATDWNFLVVGQWTGVSYGDDRKNIANTIRYFLTAFQGRKDVGLVLKINMGRNSEPDYDAVTQRIQAIKSNFPADQCPPIHLLHDTLTDNEMGELYNHPQIKSFLTLTAGEGFGLPILEAAACELPIIATNWSGHLDFLNIPKSSERLFSAVEYDIKPIPPGAIWEPILVKDSQWAIVREDDAVRRMRKMVESYATPKKWATRLAQHVHDNYTLNKTQVYFLSVLNEYVRKFGPAQLASSQGIAALVDNPDAFNVLYTMPMSTGDVFISTAIVDSIMKSVQKEHENTHIYFATGEQYFPVLEGNPNIHKCIPWVNSMMDISGMEDIFDLVLTPNIATQTTFSNWVRRGHGRNLLEEYANHCQVDIGDFFIKNDDSVFTDIMLATNGETDIRCHKYLTFHPGSGKGQWAARNYQDWNEVLENIKGYFPALKIVQVGSADEPTFPQIDIDLRGKTTVHQLASVIGSSEIHISIDTFTMHLAAASNIPLVAIFGSSHASSTGPWYRNPESQAFVLLEAEKKMGCNRACYKYTCKVAPGSGGCVNEIDSFEIVRAIISILTDGKQHLLLKAS